MNEFEDISASQLDRFVDGELSESERRDMLLAADRDPEAWRRLALAFVEAQTLRREVSALIKPIVVSPAISFQTARTGAPAALRVAGLAACCLLAFGMGRWSHSADTRMASQPNAPITTPRTFAMEDGQPQSVAAVWPENTEQHQTLRLVLDDLLGGPPQSVEVPLVNESQGDPTELLSGPPMISPELQRALLRAGQRVHEERQLFEVQLSDGRRGVVPVSNVLVENAGLDVFQ